MRKEILVGLLLIFLNACFNRQIVLARSTPSSFIKVPEDFLTIQEAINAAKPWDNILVASGTYYENIVIDKPISLIGESKESTIIVGSKTGDVVYVSSAGVEVSGFTVKGSGSDYISPFDGGDAGIELNHATNCTISNLIVMENSIGISLISSANNVIANNLVISNTGEGIFLVSSNNNLIMNNTSESNGRHGGIWLALSFNNTIINNVANLNPDHGIKLHTSNNNTVENNTCLHNKNSGIFLHNAYNNKIVDNNCSLNGCGIFLRLSENNIIASNTCKFNNENGISLDFLNYYNEIKNNTIIRNSAKGISLRLSSSYNKVVKNIVISNGEKEWGEGIHIEYSDYNEISYNIILMNRYGIKIEPIYSAHWNEFMKHYKEDVEAKIARGINVVSENSTGNEIHYNNIEGNIEFGIFNQISTKLNATFNWWGDESGPYHPTLNSNGKGNRVSDNVMFEPWLSVPVNRAWFKVASLSINPAVVKVGENVTISVEVVNVGNLEGNYFVDLKIGGVLVERRMVTLMGGETATITFEVAEEEAGVYDVEVSGLKGSFTAKSPSTPLEVYMIIVSVAIVVIGIFVVLRKKKG